MGTSKLLTPAYEFSPRILICLPLPKESFIKKKKKNLSSKTHNKYVFMTQVKDNPLRQRGSSRDDDGQQRRLTRHHVSNLRPIASRGGGEETYKKKIKKRQRWRSAPLRWEAHKVCPYWRRGHPCSESPANCVPSK